jgi:hypothetical protein
VRAIGGVAVLDNAMMDGWRNEEPEHKHRVSSRRDLDLLCPTGGERFVFVTVPGTTLHDGAL